MAPYLLYIMSFLSMVVLPFRSPNNNLCVIQLDDGYFLLASPLFALQSPPPLSVFFLFSSVLLTVVSTSHDFHQLSSAASGLQLPIYFVLPLFSWRYVVFFRALASILRLHSCRWFLQLTAAAIIYHNLHSHIEKGKEGKGRKNKGYIY